MGNTMPVLMEVGPRGKRVVAIARDWPGLERGDKTEDAALERLHTYLPRYARIADLAGLAGEYAADADLAVVARYPGVGGTDFWGISFQYLSDHDREPLSAEALERELALMRAAWRCFDEVRARVSPELRKGPRGGGRDRDQIVSHVFGNERD
ncbi:MAG: hypothetical protein WBA46_12330, partial [Thermomicrobiales bacterium]